jgi:hypothetical protein
MRPVSSEQIQRPIDSARHGDNRHTRGLAEFVSGGTKLASHAVPAPAAERIVELVLKLERLEDGHEVVQALALRPRST